MVDKIKPIFKGRINLFRVNLAEKYATFLQSCYIAVNGRGVNGVFFFDFFDLAAKNPILLHADLVFVVCIKPKNRNSAVGFKLLVEHLVAYGYASAFASHCYFGVLQHITAVFNHSRKRGYAVRIYDYKDLRLFRRFYRP